MKLRTSVSYLKFLQGVFNAATVKSSNIANEVKIVNNGNGVSFFLNTPDLSVEVRDEINISETDDVSMDFETFTKLAKVAKGEGDMYLSDECVNFSAHSGRKVGLVNNFDKERAFNLPKLNFVNMMEMPEMELLAVLKKLSKVTSKSNCRAVLMGISFNSENGYIGATDSFRLGTYDISNFVKTKLSAFTMPVIVAKVLDKLVNKKFLSDLSVYISDDFKYGKIEKAGSRGYSITFKCIEGKYPDLLGMFPDSYSYEFEGNSKKSLDSLDGFELFKDEGKKDQILNISKDGNKIYFASRNSDGFVKEEFAENENYEIDNIYISLRYFKDALTILDGDFKMGINGELKPINLYNDKFNLLVVPIRRNNH